MIRSIAITTLAYLGSGLDLSAFQPHNAFGNTIHIATADFDGIGAKDHVVTFNVNGSVTAFMRSDDIKDPYWDSRLWSLPTGTFSFMITTAKSSRAKNMKDSVFLPGADGHLRRISSTGKLDLDVEVAQGPLYTVDVGYTRDGTARIVTGGVDGAVRFLSWKGSILGTVMPVNMSLIRRLVVGDFDGDGSSEVAVFYNTGGFRGGGYITFYDLETMNAPRYWKSGAMIMDDVYNLGWTDKQLPTAYDMDGDGGDELVAHWGVMHPEHGPGTKVLSTMLAVGERLRHDDEYNDVHPFTITNEYLMQKGVPGRFKSNGEPGMLNVFGDDLHYFTYNIRKSADKDRFRCTDYGYSHTLYHFTDGARLESRVVGVPDRIVLSGPNNGDDRFYVVSLSDMKWKAQAKQIDNGGALVGIRNSLDKIVSGIDDFKGVIAKGDPVSWTQQMNYSCWTGGFGLNQTETEKRADAAIEDMDLAYANIFGSRRPKKVIIFSELNLEKVSKKANGTEEIVRWIGALAKRKLHVSLKAGHGDKVWLTEEKIKKVYRASVHDGVSYMMLQTKEIQEGSYFKLYIPLLRGLRSEAAVLKAAPSKFVFSEKGAIISGMTPREWEDFTQYKEIIVMASEDSNVRVNEWSFSERHSLWMMGDFETLGASPIGDFIATNRAAEWSAMRSGHLVFRVLLSAFVMGATVFRTDNTLPFANPLFLRGDTSDPNFMLSDSYRQGIVPFLRMVEAGVLPSAPKPWQLKGVSPVSISIPAPNSRFQDQSEFHTFKDFQRQGTIYAANYLQCWYAYTNVPDVDITSIVAGTIRRWDSLFPTSPTGFVPLVPFRSRKDVEKKSWCNRSFETDVNYWAEFSSDSEGLKAARDAIGAELVIQQANTLLVVEPVDSKETGRVFWQLMSDSHAKESSPLFLMLMDAGAFEPAERLVRVRLGGLKNYSNYYDIYDQLGSQTKPIKSLRGQEDYVKVNVPAGSMRFLTLHPATAVEMILV